MKAKKEKEKERGKDTVKDGKTGAQEKDGQDGEKQKDMEKVYIQSMTITMKNIYQKQTMKTVKTRTRTVG